MIEILGSTPLTAILGAAPDPTNHAAVRTYIKTLCDNGFSVLLCFPNSKKPFDGRTRRQRNADDKKAQTDAQAAGRVDWKKAQSPSGLALASTDHKPITKKNGYLDQYIAAFSTGGCDSCFDDGHEVPDNTDHEDCTPWEPCAVNIAIEVGGSRVVVVDCDTAERGVADDVHPRVGVVGLLEQAGEFELDHAQRDLLGGHCGAQHHGPERSDASETLLDTAVVGAALAVAADDVLGVVAEPGSVGMGNYAVGGAFAFVGHGCFLRSSSGRSGSSNGSCRPSMGSGFIESRMVRCSSGATLSRARSS